MKAFKGMHQGIRAQLLRSALAHHQSARRQVKIDERWGFAAGGVADVVMKELTTTTIPFQSRPASSGWIDKQSIHCND